MPEWTHSNPALLQPGTVALERPAHESQLQAMRIAAESAVGQDEIRGAFERFGHGAERHSFRLSVLSTEKRREEIGAGVIEPRQTIRVEVHIPINRQAEVQRRLLEQEFLFSGSRAFERRRQLTGFPGIFFFTTGPEGYATLEMDIFLKSWNPEKRHTKEAGIRQADQLLDTFFTAHPDARHIGGDRSDGIDLRSLKIGCGQVREAVRLGKSASLTDTPEGTIRVEREFEPAAHIAERAYRARQMETQLVMPADEYYNDPPGATQRAEARRRAIQMDARRRRQAEAGEHLPEMLAERMEGQRGFFERLRDMFKPRGKRELRQALKPKTGGRPPRRGSPR